MDSNPSIPVLEKPISMMEVGPNGNNLASQAMARHPVEDLQKNIGIAKFNDLSFVRNVYGSGLAMRLATEQKFAAQERSRNPFRSQGLLYGEIVTGHDTKFDMADFLPRAEYRADLKQDMNLHVAMERQLGL
ncbi:hypothetical protein FisN_1Hh721 [Fistulifera solaris]|jgi:hypothetical protein|uniref:Proteasome maturation protein n=1 Tax=Fistulifera solaris TaxID=1519565 RepID=A0A1Z5JMS3_FISSO|nr:hypothetical protein FisN_1Hh721 [Fistulifera solaris]|eukprot:GAX15284.1 hypothetical protein FisN_1Hh721 [Fistulifera solaris]